MKRPSNRGRVGDINNDSFEDIGIGVPASDFVDTSLPQDPSEPGTNRTSAADPTTEAWYILYGITSRVTSSNRTTETAGGGGVETPWSQHPHGEPKWLEQA